MSKAQNHPAIFNNDIRFSEILLKLAKSSAPELVQGDRHPEPLAKFEYNLELDLKNQALQEFWKVRKLPGKPNPILPSPRPRHYRTTTKRRVDFYKGKVELAYLTESIAVANPKAGKESLVEPKEHAKIYAFLLGKLNTPAYSIFAQALNFLILRGDYEKFTVLFNVHTLNADIVRKAKLLSDHLQKLDVKVVSSFIYFDPSHSEFYFEARTFDGPWKLKKIFGFEEIQLKVLDQNYRYNPTAFCQVNASILPSFLEKALALLKPSPEYRLIDLYSGFGFFTFYLGPKFKQAFGIDLGATSIDSAKKMAAKNPKSNCQFRSGRIQVENLDNLLPALQSKIPEMVLLDPPRQGTEPGVIAAIAARRPKRVLHIFCDLDTIPKEISEWRNNGCEVSEIAPLDMFPGTDNLEVMVLLNLA